MPITATHSKKDMRVRESGDAQRDEEWRRVKRVSEYDLMSA